MPGSGRGSGPGDDDPEGKETLEAGPPRGSPDVPGARHVIAPYDPYRSRTDDASRPSRRDVTVPAPPPAGTSSRRNDVFLPDDDPLNAEAWQLEGDDLGGTALPSESTIDRAPPPRRSPRPPGRSQESRATPSTARRTPRRSRAAGAPRRAEAARPTLTIGVPQIVAGSPLIADQTALLLLGINAISFVIMALFVGVRIGAVPSPAVLRLDAAGNPALWGSPQVLWRLPLMSAAITIMFLAVAWFLHPLDRFGARFALGAAVIAQIIAWVAVIQHLA